MCQQPCPLLEVGPAVTHRGLTSPVAELTPFPSPEAPERGSAGPHGDSTDQELDLSLFGGQKTREQNVNGPFVKLANNSDLTSFFFIEFDVNKIRHFGFGA